MPGNAVGVMIRAMASAYEMLAKLNGELRIYIETQAPIELSEIQSQLGYSYASESSHHASNDPWCCAFGEPRRLDSEVDFFKERDRVAATFCRNFGTSWEAELLYHPPGRGKAIYHWSRAEGILHLSHR